MVLVKKDGSSPAQAALQAFKLCRLSATCCRIAGALPLPSSPHPTAVTVVPAAYGMDGLRVAVGRAAGVRSTRLSRSSSAMSFWKVVAL